MKIAAGMVAVVTGAASGIGLALTEALAGRGVRVVAVDRSAVQLNDAVERIRGDIFPITADVTDAAAVRRVADTAFDRYGAVNLLVNNAGIVRSGTAYDTSVEDWAAVLDVNLWGAIHACRSFVPRMKVQNGPAHVLNTGSISGYIVVPAMAAYIVSKHAVVALSETLAVDLADAGVGVTVVNPSGVATDIFKSERRRLVADGAPLRDPRFDTWAGDRTDQLLPSDVADRALQAVEDGELHAFIAVPTQLTDARDRMARIDAAMGRR